MPSPTFYPFTPIEEDAHASLSYGDKLGRYTRRRVERILERNHTPKTEVQALMEAAAREEPRTSLEEQLPTFDALTAAIEKLTEREQWVITAMFYEGLSLRQVEAQLALSKTQVARVRDSALAKLRCTLAGDVASIEV